MSASGTAKDLNCWNCGQQLTDVLLPISRHEHCPKCFEALHCCRLCRHYRPDTPGQCDEDRADPPVTKENANFCDWFRPRSGISAAARTDRSASAEAELAALFGADDEAGDATQDPAVPDADDGTDSKPAAEPASKAAAARAKLDSLFGKDS